VSKLILECESRNGIKTVRVTISTLVIAGWAGRDKAAMEHHIAELEALGVARPDATPTFYRISAARLTTDDLVEDAGSSGSGEAETVIFAFCGRLYVGLGSDHTDRKLETVGVAVSKQMCDKPVARRVWPFDEVRDHWDSLILRSHVVIDGTRHLYQEGSVAGLMPPQALIEEYSKGAGLADGTAMFGGTMPAIGGIRYADRFESTLEDPVLGRTIRLAYAVRGLPVAG
jgi:hypothetical protein